MIAMSLLVAVARRTNPHRPLPPYAVATRGAAARAKSCDRSAPFSTPKPSATPAAAPVKVPAVAGVPPATVKRLPVPPTTVAGTLLQLAKDFRAAG